MTEIVSSEPAPFIPDNLTLPQFFFDSDHSLKATRPPGVPYFIEDATGRGISSREVSFQTHPPNAMILTLSLGPQSSRRTSEWLESQMGHK